MKDMPGIASHPRGEPSTARRVLLLCACAAAGLAAGAVGWWMTADSRWMLALLGVIALGWLFVADPNRCEPPANRREP